MSNQSLLRGNQTSFSCFRVLLCFGPHSFRRRNKTRFDVSQTTAAQVQTCPTADFLAVFAAPPHLATASSSSRTHKAAEIKARGTQQEHKRRPPQRPTRQELLPGRGGTKEVRFLRTGLSPAEPFPSHSFTYGQRHVPSPAAPSWRTGDLKASP